MTDNIDILISVALGSSSTVALLCALLLHRGGVITMNQEAKEPTRIQRYFSWAMLTFALFGFVYLTNDYLVAEPSVTLRHLIDAACYPISTLFIFQAKVLMQKQVRPKDWMIHFGPYLPLILSVLTIYDTHPTVFFLVNIMTYAYLIGTIIYTFFRLSRWDRELLDIYSDVTRKQTEWFRRMMLPYLIMLLLWIPMIFNVDMPWGYVIYYNMLTVIYVLSTTHTLAQEEFNPALLLNKKDEPSDAVQQESQCLSHDKTGDSAHTDELSPSWVSNLDKVMKTEALYKNPELNLAELAKAVGTNRSYLSKYFNDSLSVTFYEYINNIRILEAEKLLSTTDKSLDVIATECGFKSRSTFYSIFRKKHDMSPSSWREEKKEA